MKAFKVTFQPSGRRGEVEEGKTVLEASRELGAEIESLCGGAKACGKCRVKLEEGELSPFTEEEGKFINDQERTNGYRLGCVARVEGDALLFVPEESRAEKQVVRKAATERQIRLNPAIRLFHVELTPPTFQDPLGDFERLTSALSQKHGLSSLRIDYHALLRLPRALREGRWTVGVAIWMEEEIIDVRPGRVEAAYGLAVDVGTTTVAAYLCNLITGQLVATHSMMNPQVTFGEDVMSRITYVMTHPEDGLEKMHASIVQGLNQLARAATEEQGLRPEDILELVIVGNTAMHHLLLRIHPEYIGVSPFTPALHRSLDIKARDLGIHVHPSANVHVLPIEAGFVGADNVGVLIAEEPHRQDEMVLIIDIGTNGELVMGNRKILISSSCATGPALEGAHIKFGMRAAPGAIERVHIDPDTLEVNYKVIGQEPWNSEQKVTMAKGICGSGIVDAMAELFRAGIIDKSGRFNRGVPSRRFRITDERPEFVIAWKDETSIGREITITQQDVRSVQLAKGALYTGAKLMMKRLGIERLDSVILAGAFGSYIDPQEAMILGMFPDCDLKNAYAVGNAAGDGARIALLDREKRAEANELAREVEYVELTIEDNFQNEFMEALQVPHMTDPFPHLKGIVPNRKNTE
jgi:uncharacterized 2Fe-2S/4Fe-4S cluster protein (DUF4445 family)